MTHADALSRLPLSYDTNVSSINSLNFSFYSQPPVDIELVRKGTEKDPVLSKVMSYLMSKWPLQVCPELSSFINLKEIV